MQLVWQSRGQQAEAEVGQVEVEEITQTKPVQSLLDEANRRHRNAARQLS